MAQLCIRLFGTFQMTVDGVEVSGFASNKVRALLAYLVLEAGQPHRREKLAGLLWPDYPEASASANLRTALANLRSVIGDRAASKKPMSTDDSSAPQPCLIVSRQTIQFNSASGVWTDVVSFIEVVGQGALEALEQAAELYRGDFLEGFSIGDAPLFEEWALLNRERYRRLVIDALGRLADGRAERGEYEQALPHAWRQVELDPWRETAHQQLMLLLASSGRRAEALVQYETCCRLLAAELGVAPSEATVAIYEQICLGELVAPRQPQGRTRARADLLPSSSELHATAGAQKLVFVAREAELARLGACLDSAMAGQGSLFFICGEAGSGKTALMAEFARLAMKAHPDLVVAGGECSAYSGFGDPYLPFRSMLTMLSGDVHTHWSAGIASPEHARRLWEAMPSTIDTLVESGLQVLDVFFQRDMLMARAASAAREGDPWLRHVRQWLEQPQTRSERADQSQLFQQTTNVLREISRAHPLLLIVDDLQWADTASLGLLFHLGRRLRGSRILLLAAFRPEEVEAQRAGERHPLQKLVSEFRRRYGDISVELYQTESTGRAFVDALLDTEPNRLGEGFRRVLFQRTSGHPLFTIELLRAMQEGGELLLDESGRWVAGPALDWQILPTRVEGVIEERLGRLDEGQREILRMASIEGDRFTAQVIARMLNTDEHKLLRTLSRELGERQRLVRWLSILQIKDRRLLRYRFSHALFQQYLYASIDPGERQFLHGEIAAILEDLHREDTTAIVPQLAWHYSEAGDEPRAAQYLTLAADVALADYASHEAETGYRKALDLAWDDAQRVYLLEGLGRALAQQSRFTEALLAWQDAIGLSRSLGDLEGMARLYAYSSSAAWWSGDLAHQLRLCEEGLGATVGAAASADKAHLLQEAARAYWFQGSPEQAKSLCQEALAMAEQSGAVDVQAGALVTLGSISFESPQDSEVRLVRAAELAENANLPDIAFRARNNLALLKSVVHGPQAARGEVERAIDLCRQTGNVAQELLALTNLVEAFLALGELEQAQANLSRMRQLVVELDDPGSMGDRIRRLGAMVLLYQGQWLEAASLLQLSRVEAKEKKRPEMLLNADWFLAQALLEAASLEPSSDLGLWDEAECVLVEVRELGASMGEADINAWCRSRLVTLYARWGRPDQARDMLDETRAAAKDYPYPPVETAVLSAEAQAAFAEARLTEALTFFESLAGTFASCGMRWDRARTLIDWAAAHAARGDPADLSRARSLLRESEAEFEEMGGLRYADLARERLQSLSTDI